MIARTDEVIDVYDATATERPHQHTLSPREGIAVQRERVASGWWGGRIVGEFARVVRDDLEAA